MSMDTACEDRVPSLGEPESRIRHYAYLDKEQMKNC